MLPKDYAKKIFTLSLTTILAFIAISMFFKKIEISDIEKKIDKVGKANDLLSDQRRVREKYQETTIAKKILDIPINFNSSKKKKAYNKYEMDILSVIESKSVIGKLLSLDKITFLYSHIFPCRFEFKWQKDMDKYSVRGSFNDVALGFYEDGMKIIALDGEKIEYEVQRYISATEIILGVEDKIEIDMLPLFKMDVGEPEKLKNGFKLLKGFCKDR